MYRSESNNRSYSRKPSSNYKKDGYKKSNSSKKYSTNKSNKFNKFDRDHKKNNSYNKKPRVVENKPKVLDTEEMNRIKDQIITTTKANINTEKVGYKVFISDKKIELGALSITFKIHCKEDNTISKLLIFTVSADVSRGLYTVSIISLANNEPHVLFATTDKYLIPKLTKYIPTIMESTQKLLFNSLNK